MRLRTAFTLIELLVVIGIITILIGILLPVIARARIQAKRAQTLSNLHQIGTSVVMYEQQFNGFPPTDLSDANQDGRAFSGLELLAFTYHLAPELFVNPNTNDAPATAIDPLTGWPVFFDIGGVPVTLTAPPVIDFTNVQSVNFHCSFAYDHEKKRSGRRFAQRVYMGDRADYPHQRSFSNNWDGKGMCLLWNDQHAEFSTSKSMADQLDPNIYHHNQYLDDKGNFPGEGATEVVNGIAVTPDTLDTHLRIFSESEDDTLLPNE